MKGLLLHLHFYRLSIYFIEVKIMRSCELVASITALACKITECYLEEEVALLAAIFTQLGDTLGTILAHSDLSDTNNKNDTDTKC